MEPHNRLAAWLQAENISQAEMARRCDYDRSNFHRLLSGKLSPSLPLAARIERETGGAVRIGFCHYNTEQEVDRILAELASPT